MKHTQPKVRLLAEPMVHWSEIKSYLQPLGGMRWFDRMVDLMDEGGISEAEALIEYAGRRCYKSWDVGLNPNVTRVREDSAEYLQNILKSKHGAVIEHAQVTFDFDQVSRVFTHELVRHRAGVAISQESLRYVRLTELGFRIPDILSEHSDRIVSMVETLEDFQKDMADAFGLDDDGVPFHYKKEVTSALRRLAPIGLSTGMVWSANFRTLRHVIQQRTAGGAEEEIRLVFDQVARICKDRFMFIFGDFEEVEVEGSSIPAWVPAHLKV